MSSKMARYLPITKHTIKTKLSNPWTGKTYSLNFDKVAEKQIVKNYTVPYNYTLPCEHVVHNKFKTKYITTQVSTECEDKFAERSIPNIPEQKMR